MHHRGKRAVSHGRVGVRQEQEGGCEREEQEDKDEIERFEGECHFEFSFLRWLVRVVAAITRHTNTNAVRFGFPHGVRHVHTRIRAERAAAQSFFWFGIAYEPLENVAPNCLMFLSQFVYMLNILQIFESLEKGQSRGC